MARQARHPGHAGHRHEGSTRKRELEGVRAGAGDEVGAVRDSDHALELSHQGLVVDAFLTEFVTERDMRDAVQIQDVVLGDLDDLIRHEMSV